MCCYVQFTTCAVDTPLSTSAGGVVTSTNINALLEASSVVSAVMRNLNGLPAVPRQKHLARLLEDVHLRLYHSNCLLNGVVDRCEVQKGVCSGRGGD